MSRMMVNYICGQISPDSSAANHFFNNKYPNSLLIGPLYEDFPNYIDDLHIKYLMDYCGKKIYIDSAALFITNRQVYDKQIVYCEKDSSLLCENEYQKVFEHCPLINYVKRALMIYKHDDNSNKIVIMDADTVFLPIVTFDIAVIDGE